MAPVRSTTVRDLRRGNRAKVLWELYLGGDMSRQELTARTGLSAGTVTNVTSDLLAEGVLLEVGSEDSEGGRPRGVLGMNASFASVIGVDLAEQKVLVEIFDMAMTVLASHTSQLESSTLDPDEVARHILDGMRVVTETSGVDPSHVLGVGVGVPGLVEHGPDDLVHGQSVGWVGVPFGRMLRAGTDVPVLVENGAKTRGQGEMWFGAGRGARNVVVALIGTGVGASIIADGELYRGATSSAGEWGHTTSEVGGRMCRCGSSGCLEAYVGAGFLAIRYAELTGETIGADDSEEARADIVVQRAADGDAAAAQVISEWVTRLGAGLADLVNLFNPERIIIGGWLGRRLAPTCLDAIRVATKNRALHLPFSHTTIVAAELGVDEGALGAATLPIDRLLTNGALPVAPSPRRTPIAARGSRA
ncbi:MAG: hypothetical protein QOI42_2290 [Frankiaceae bacterium]|jgi:predicted NBD/HSP70 family sugar kinase|nr:hypothetical protein [Frankiaceae bacterium]